MIERFERRTDYPIGTVLVYDGKIIKVCGRSGVCSECALKGSGGDCSFAKCVSDMRKDKARVYFKDITQMVDSILQSIAKGENITVEGKTYTLTSEE